MQKTPSTPGVNDRRSFLRLRDINTTLLLPLTGILYAFSIASVCAKTWQVGNGNWNVPANWDGGVPGTGTTSADNADFAYSSTHPSVAVNITAKADANLMRIALGQTVTLNLSSGITLTAGSISRVGDTNLAMGTGPSTLNINGPSTGSNGIVAFNQVFIQNGSSMVLSGSRLRVTSASSFILGLGSLGTFRADNSLIVKDGAKFTTNGIYVGHPTSGDGAQNNYVAIEANSTVTSNSATPVAIGGAAEDRSNYISVSGSNALLEVTSTSVNAKINIGDEAAANYGGNYLEITAGGEVNTRATVNINGYTFNDGDNGGSNKLIIGNGGSFISSSSITNHGLLQLAAGGTLKGETAEKDPTALAITVADGGRFEAAGTGLGSTVETSVNAGGTFAVGLAEETSATQFTLDSGMNFASGSFLEVSLFANGTMDSIHLLEDGVLTGEVNLVLNYSAAPLTGSWQLFTGNISGIEATFNLSGLDPQIWDTSLFNSTGEWRLSVIPEPSSIAMLLTAGLCLGGYGLRRRITSK